MEWLHDFHKFTIFITSEVQQKEKWNHEFGVKLRILMILFALNAFNSIKQYTLDGIIQSKFLYAYVKVITSFWRIALSTVYHHIKWMEKKGNAHTRRAFKMHM